MRGRMSAASTVMALAVMCAAPLAAQNLCTGFGPQTPRDISDTAGSNPNLFSLAPAASEMNLCNIHAHRPAEHKGPGFSTAAEGDGFVCADAANLTEGELEELPEGSGAFEDVVPGDTIEVHWVHTSCAVEPGPGLTSCSSAACANPELRVETQVFLIVNDPNALDFSDFAYAGNVVDGRHQAKALPDGTGEPVVFAGSTTGGNYNDEACSPLQVTWSVRPQCAKLDIGSLKRWADSDPVFAENEAHNVRGLVTAPELLSPIE